MANKGNAVDDFLGSTIQTVPAKVLDGVNADCEKHSIGGNNYFKLRDLGTTLGFEVGYDRATNTAIVRSAQK